MRKMRRDNISHLQSQELGKRAKFAEGYIELVVQKHRQFLFKKKEEEIAHAQRKVLESTWQPTLTEGEIEINLEQLRSSKILLC